MYDSEVQKQRKIDLQKKSEKLMRDNIEKEKKRIALIKHIITKEKSF